MFLCIVLFVSISYCDCQEAHTTGYLCFMPNNTYILNKNEQLLLNCSFEISRNDAGHLDIVKLNLFLGSHLLKSIEYQNRQNGFRGSIIHKVNYLTAVKSMKFICQLIMTNDGLEDLTTEVIFNSPPNLPKSLFSSFHGNDLYVYGHLTGSPLVHKSLDTKYSISVNATNSKLLQLPCEIYYNNYLSGGETLKCSIKATKYPVYEFVILAANSAGNASSSRLTTLKIDAEKQEAVIDRSHRQTNLLIVQIRHNIAKMSIGEIRYMLRYRKSEQTVFMHEQDAYSNTIELRHLEANTCYDISVSLVVKIFPGVVVNVEWSKWSKHCTLPLQIVGVPENFTCQEHRVNKRESVAVVQLLWRKAEPEKQYGLITGYLLEIDFGSKDFYEPHSEMLMPDAYSSTLVCHNEFYVALNVTFYLSLCNLVGCAKTRARCPLTFFNHHIPTESAPVWIVVSCIIPIIIMAMLIGSAIVAYYRKKMEESALEEDLLTARDTPRDGLKPQPSPDANTPLKP